MRLLLVALLLTFVNEIHVSIVQKKKTARTINGLSYPCCHFGEDLGISHNPSHPFHPSIPASICFVENE